MQHRFTRSHRDSPYFLGQRFFWIAWLCPPLLPSNEAIPSPFRPPARQMHALWQSSMSLFIWGFHQWGLPQSGWLIRKNPIKLDDLGVPMGTPISGNLHLAGFPCCARQVLLYGLLRELSWPLSWWAAEGYVELYKPLARYWRNYFRIRQNPWKIASELFEEFKNTKEILRNYLPNQIKIAGTIFQNQPKYTGTICKITQKP